MRLSSILPATLGLALATAAAAQQTPAKAPSVSDYLCTFAHKCGPDGSAPVQTIDAPRTKGFRLARVTPTPAASDSFRLAHTAPLSSTQRVAGTTRTGTAGGRRSYAGEGVGTVAPGRRGSRYAVPVTMPVAGAGTGLPRADLVIGFELNSARLTPAGVASARVFAQSLLTPELSGKRFVIEGHTDLRGGHALNMDLSQRRAQAVADFLVVQGVERSRLTTRGLGPDVPLPGHKPSDPGNRRVEAELGS